MKNKLSIEKLSLRGFRGFKKESIIDFHPQLNILFGINGSGKSSILYALNIVISNVILSITGKNQQRKFLPEDLNTGSSTSKIVIDFTDNKNYKVEIEFNKNQQININEPMHIKKLLGNINSETSLPIFLYLSVNRLLTNKNKIDEGIKQYPIQQLRAYEDALLAQTDFNYFLNWFYQQENIELEKKVREKDMPGLKIGMEEEKKVNISKSKLEFVRNAITDFTGFSKIKIVREPYLHFVMEKDQIILTSKHLSDGEKGLFALVGDIASRLVTLNPSIDNPLKGTGIVLIDEIDLHLHPKWQRMIIPNLMKTFPNIQFIITTHSPQILSHAKSKNVFFLNQYKDDIKIQNLDDIGKRELYGSDSNRILESIMDTDERPAKIKEELLEMFNLIDSKNFDKANEKIKTLYDVIGNDPEIGRAKTIINRKRKLGR